MVSESGRSCLVRQRIVRCSWCRYKLISRTHQTQSNRERDELDVAQIDQLRVKQKQLEEGPHEKQELVTTQPKTIAFVDKCVATVQESDCISY